jgi:hypothetical protein
MTTTVKTANATKASQQSIGADMLAQLAQTQAELVTQFAGVIPELVSFVTANGTRSIALISAIRNITKDSKNITLIDSKAVPSTNGAYQFINAYNNALKLAENGTPLNTSDMDGLTVDQIKGICLSALQDVGIAKKRTAKPKVAESVTTESVLNAEMVIEWLKTTDKGTVARIMREAEMIVNDSHIIDGMAVEVA